MSNKENGRDIGDIITKAAERNKAVYIDLETFKKIGDNDEEYKGEKFK